MTNLFIIGEIRASHLSSFTDKQTGVVTTNCNVTIEFNLTDKEDREVIETGNFSVDVKYLELLKNSKGKFIILPVRFFGGNAENRASVYINKSFDFTIFDKNPLLQQTDIKKTA